MDKLSIIGIELWARVGCTPEERAFPQRLLLDVVLELPLAAAGRSDEMKHTVDYAAFLYRVKESLEGKSYRLIETIAEDAARLALAEKKVRAASVRILKRAVPGIDGAIVEIRRARKK